jgi:predicted metal-dependent hydrolase
MTQSGQPSRRNIAVIRIGSRIIELEIIFSHRTQLTINVHPDMAITVRAPLSSTVEEVKHRVRKKSAWIIKQLNYFEKFQPLPTKRQYVSGETHLYLGRQYRLKVVEDGSESVKLKGKYFWVFTEDKDNTDKIESLVNKWYWDHAMALLKKRLELLMENARKLTILNPNVKFRKMSKRWGSCAKSGNITLNTELIKAPIHCIDYVIVHELCHLRQKNHNFSFWRLLSRLMPDWEKRKSRLEEILI